MISIFLGDWSTFSTFLSTFSMEKNPSSRVTNTTFCQKPSEISAVQEMDECTETDAMLGSTPVAQRCSRWRFFFFLWDQNWPPPKKNGVLYLFLLMKKLKIYSDIHWIHWFKFSCLNIKRWWYTQEFLGWTSTIRISFKKNHAVSLMQCPWVGSTIFSGVF